MSQNKFKRLALSVLGTSVLLTAAFVAPSSSSARPVPQADSAANAGSTVVHRVPSSDQRNAATYWTPARMAKAKPMVKRLDGAPDSATSAPAAADGAASAVAPRTARGKAVPNALVETGAERPMAMGYTYPFPFTRTAVYPTSQYRASSRRVNGKIFFTQNGGNYVCSGTVVTAQNRNQVWTAGHCLSNGAGVFNSSTVFVPAYDGNASSCCPYGTWTANSLVVASDWHNTGSFRRDLGAFNVNPVSGVNIQNRVGGAGFAWNQSRNQDFVDFGYPAASPFNGTSMQNCFAGYAIADTGVGGAGPAPSGIGCDMTGGSSGGSWQIAWGGSSGAVPGYINGHNDYKWSNQPLAMYSPYFDTLANTVRCAIQPRGVNGCP